MEAENLQLEDFVSTKDGVEITHNRAKVFYCIILYCMVLYCSVLYGIVLFYTVLICTILLLF